MPSSTVAQIMDAMAAQLQAELGGTADPLIEQLQVYGRMNLNPTPPAIDIYPSSEGFTVGLGFGSGNREFMFTVRARVSTADHEEGQDLLLSMMDPRATTSVSGALLSDDTLGSTVERVVPGDPTGFGVYPTTGTDGNLLGCAWPVRVIP